MANDNLIISDAEYIFAEKVLLNYVTVLQEVSANYTKVMSSVLTYSIKTPQITDKLTSLHRLMNLYNRNLAEIGESIQGKGKEFIQTIDEKDQFIY